MTDKEKEDILLLIQVVKNGSCDIVPLHCMKTCPIKRSFHYGVKACQYESYDNAVKYLSRYPESMIFEALL